MSRVGYGEDVRVPRQRERQVGSASTPRDPQILGGAAVSSVCRETGSSSSSFRCCPIPDTTGIRPRPRNTRTAQPSPRRRRHRYRSVDGVRRARDLDTTVMQAYFKCPWRKR
jgi:hypothetical protein